MTHEVENDSISPNSWNFIMTAIKSTINIIYFGDTS